jgi:hypothetical protein
MELIGQFCTIWQYNLKSPAHEVEYSYRELVSMLCSKCIVIVYIVAASHSSCISALRSRNSECDLIVIASSFSRLRLSFLNLHAASKLIDSMCVTQTQAGELTFSD